MDWNELEEAIAYELWRGRYTEILPQLTDLHFERGKYISSLKLDGSKPKHPRKDKTTILHFCPLTIKEWGEDRKGVIKLYQEGRGITGYGEATIALAKYLGIEVKGTFDETDDWKQRKKKRQVMEVAQDYFVFCLHNSPNADEEKKYLLSRFNEEEIETMGLGFIPSRDKLKEKLINSGCDQADVDAFIERMNGYIGSTHRITIPIYRAGNIANFNFRMAGNKDGLNKYQYLKNEEGVVERRIFDYIPPRLRDGIIIVEGQLDALHLQAAGFNNVVATGTNSISASQVEDAIRRGCKSFTLLYDMDENDSTRGNKLKALETIIEEVEREGKQGSIEVSVAELPQPDKNVKIDPDKFVRENGIDELNKVIYGATHAYKYAIRNIKANYEENTAKYGYSEREHKEYIYNLLDAEKYAKDIVTRRYYKSYIEELEPVLCGEIEKILEERQREQDKKKAEKKAAEYVNRANALLACGDVAGAMTENRKAANVMAIFEADEKYKEAKNPYTKERLQAELADMPDALYTGLYLGTQKEANEIVFPSAAISIIAAPTSHGKTTFLISFAVDCAKKNKAEGNGKKCYLFSYEEAGAAVVVKALSSYADTELSRSNNNTITSYLKEDTTKYFKDEDVEKVIADFKTKERDFFAMVKEGYLNLNYTDMYAETLCSTIRKLADDGDAGAVFIDYIQYLNLANNRTSRKTDEIGEICRLLKDVAVETGLPIILGAQFNREVVDPTNIALANIGEAGEIERKAAYVLGCWNNDMPYQKRNNKDIPVKEILEKTGNVQYDAGKPGKNKSIYVEVLKNRSGWGAKAGTHGNLYFNGNISKVGNLEQSNDSEFETIIQ